MTCFLNTFQLRLLFITLICLNFGQVWSQTPDDYVKAIEKLRRKGKLKTKSSVDKTFAGSVTVYYHNDSLVLINSLTDAEAAGTETLYFVKDGVLMKVFIIAATFMSHDEWTDYYARHKSANKCYRCHGEPNCVVTEITLGISSTIVVTEGSVERELTGGEKERMLADVQRDSNELKELLKSDRIIQ